MSKIQIVTPQNVKLNLNSATIGNRIFAYLIDLLIKLSYLFVIFLLLSIIGAFSMDYYADTWSRNAVIILFSLPAVFYTITLETILNGQTIGKKLLKIRVININGYALSFFDLMMRWSLRIVDINSLFGIIGIITMASNKNTQRLGGLASGTAVIYTKTKTTLSHTILEEVSEEYQPSYPSVINLSDNDMRIIKDSFIEAKKLKDFKTILRIREKIEAVIQVKDNSQKAMTFIEIVIKDYNYYTKNM